ncbi:uncharacterized protein TM35_000201580 [Trypanosoma theileri]|uniref:Uncharacterized protein n=1 Tax=Trypanosoma theileri TaxID=67003 RepID=A0A1X0NU85_9TRYP|nr:uncharacterized protein TM35_000201580 [Trypanosoma theileri]ORC87749.1 hypothetical protein TM35_000201580 [Trypanosoma theileri]
MRPVYNQQRNNPYRAPYQANPPMQVPQGRVPYQTPPPGYRGMPTNGGAAMGGDNPLQRQCSYGYIPSDYNNNNIYGGYNQYAHYNNNNNNNNNSNNSNPSAYVTPRGVMYAGPGGSSYFGSFGSKNQLGQLERENSVMLNRGNGSQFGSFRGGPSGSFGSLYNAGSFMGYPNNGGYGSFRGGYPGMGNSNNGFQRVGSFQRYPSNYSTFPSVYGSSYIGRTSSGASTANPVLQRTESGINLNYNYGGIYPAGQNLNNGISGFHQEPSQASLFGSSGSNFGDNGGLVRHNSMTLLRTNSATNGFYEFGPVMNGSAGESNVTRLSQGRLNGRPAAPSQWERTGTTPTAMPQSVPTPAPRVGRSTDQSRPNGTNSTSSGTGELTRKGSEKRIGMYFKDVKPTQSNEYKKEGDPGTGRSARSTDPSMMTNVRTVLLLSRMGGKIIEVDGSTAIVEKPNSDELQKFDTNAIVYISPNEPNVFVESLDELRDTFVQGCNIALIMADSDGPAHLPSSWFTWNTLRRLVKDTFARLSHRSEFTVSISLLEDDQVMDLLASHPHYTTLTVAQSPLFGNVPHGVIYQLVEDASEFEILFDRALEQAVGRKGEENGILLVSGILKQIRTSSSNSGEEDIILSSIFAAGVGDGIIHYNRILDKNPAEPRAMFQFALGGPSMTAAVFSLTDKEGNDAVVSNFLSTLNRLGDIQNYRLRLGSVRRFVRYSEESIPKTRTKIRDAAEGKEKAAMQRSLARLEVMVADAKVMLEEPDSAVPKTYIRQ